MNMEKLAALTFDDGPNTVTTPQVLDALEKHGVPASFFAVGKRITPETAEVMRRAASMGCEIENHSRSHTTMTELTPEQIQEEVNYTSDKVEEATGRRPQFFRPPYIAYDQKVFENIDLTFVCGVGADDWNNEVPAEERARRIVSQMSDGVIILLHDMVGNSITVEALDLIIPEFKENGFNFVTVSQLFTRKGITPRRGVIYTNVFNPFC